MSGRGLTSVSMIRSGFLQSRGPAGPQGVPGKDGISPTVRVERTDAGARITATDASGTTSTDIADGLDAPQIDKICPPFETSGSVVECYPMEGYPLDVATCIEAVQGGEGDPSPENVRPIGGWDSLTVTRNGDAYTQALPETVYGGRYDWAAGELTVDHQLLNLADMNWRYESNAYFVGRSSHIKEAIAPAIGICSHYPYFRNYSGRVVFASGTVIYCGSDLAKDYDGDVTAWVNYLDEQAQKGTPVQIVQKLSKPYTIHLAPQQILALPGVNTLISSAGPTKVSGLADPIHLTQSMLDRLAALEAAQTGL